MQFRSGDCPERREMEIFWLMKNLRFPCLFFLWTGLYCPGCGGTRAVRALCSGRLLVSALYHPLVPYCALVAGWFAFSWLLYWKTKNPRYRRYLGNSYVYAGAGLIAVNFLVKNLLLVFFKFDTRPEP